MESALEPATVLPAAENRPTADLDLGQTVRGLSVGQRVFSRYTLQRILGRGGMGVVWLAQDDKLEREVALKFVPELLFLDPAARDDLKRETRRSLELTHPHIVRIYDFMEDDAAAAISMEYVDGSTLSRLRVEQPGRIFEPAEMEPWLGGLCTALDYAHGTARMVHRDLKPANLMLGSRGGIKITDFGIACSLMGSVARVSVYSSSAGTLVYMSPQQMHGETPSPLDDIYALGATLYELLTGKPPFYTGNITHQVCEVEAESLSARRARLGVRGMAIPEAWEHTIAACLAKHPEDRPRSAGEVLSRLSLAPLTVPTTFAQTTAPTLRVAGPPFNGAAAPPTARSTGVSAQPAPRPEPPAIRIPLPVAAGTALAVGVVLLIGFFWPHRAAQVSVPAVPLAEHGSTAGASVAPEERAGAVSRGGLMIKTIPEGATVELGGEAVESSPATFKGIAPGKYPVKITLSEYEPVQTKAEIKPGEFADLGTISLVHSTGSVQLTTTPEGSDYELKPDGDATAGAGPGAASTLRGGKTPVTLHDVPTGSYTLALKHPGWPDQVRHLEIKRGEALPVEWEFARGQLAVTSLPAGAKVYLGDRLLGTTPLTAELAPGSYNNVQVMLDGYVPVTLTATVQQGDTATLAAGTLQPMVTALQLSTQPAGLDYTITGTAGSLRHGQTPAAVFDLPVGDYTVTFQRPGWADFTAPAHLEAKQPVTVSHDFPEGSVSVTSVPPGAEILHGGQSLGVAPLTLTLPPGSTELTARLEGQPTRKECVTVADGEETSLVFNLKSGHSATSTGHHHHHQAKKAPPSELARIGDSIKAFFSGGSSSGAKPHR